MYPFTITFTSYSHPFLCFQFLQGLGSIIYHQCPNNRTKGIDVIPMQATALLAVNYILIKILVRKAIKGGRTEFENDEIGESFIPPSHNETELSELPNENSPIAIWCKKKMEHIISGMTFGIQLSLIILTIWLPNGNSPIAIWCNKNMEHIISGITFGIQFSLMILTICIQLFTSHQNVTIPVIIAFFLYIGACSVTFIFMCINTKQIHSSKVGCILNVIAISTFIGGAVCFVTESTQTGGEPWESREKNKDCWIGMFDQHDLWHFLVATSLAFQIYRLWMNKFH